MTSLISGRHTFKKDMFNFDCVDEVVKPLTEDYLRKQAVAIKDLFFSISILLHERKELEEKSVSITYELPILILIRSFLEYCASFVLIWDKASQEKSQHEAYDYVLFNYNIQALLDMRNRFEIKSLTSEFIKTIRNRFQEEYNQKFLIGETELERSNSLDMLIKLKMKAKGKVDGVEYKLSKFLRTPKLVKDCTNGRTKMRALYKKFKPEEKLTISEAEFYEHYAFLSHATHGSSMMQIHQYQHTGIGIESYNNYFLPYIIYASTIFVGMLDKYFTNIFHLGEHFMEELNKLLSVFMNEAS